MTENSFKSKIINRATIWLPICFILLYFIFQVILNYGFFVNYCQPLTDFILISLAVETAKDLEAFSGAYSRLGFRHPGPIWFYLYALSENLFYWIPAIEGRYALMQLGLSLCFVCLSVVISASQSAQIRQAWISGPLLILLLTGSDGTALTVLSNVWNPYAAISAFTCFVICCATVASGRVKFIPLLFLSGLFSLHAHLSLLPVISGLVVFTFARVLRKRDLEGKLAKNLIIAIIITFLLSLPIIYDLMTSPEFGNLGAIVKFSLDSKVEHGIYSILSLMVHYWSKPLTWFGGSASIIFTLLCWASLIYPAKGSPFMRELRFTTLVGIAVAAFSIQRTQGELFPYLSMYVFGLVFANYLGLVYALGDLLRHLSTSKYKVVSKLTEKIIWLRPGLIFSLILWVNLLGTVKTLNVQAHCGTLAEAKVLMGKLALKPNRLYKIQMVNPRLWHSGAALALRMKRAGLDVCVDDSWWFVFGRSLTCSYRCSKHSVRSYKRRSRVISLLTTNDLEDVEQANSSETELETNSKKFRFRNLLVKEQVGEVCADNWLTVN